MKHINSYLFDILNGDFCPSVSGMREVLLKDFLSSGVRVVSDDACAPLVKEGGFLKVFSDRMFEGAIGANAVEAHEQIQSEYEKVKKNDKRLVYSFSTEFKKVGSVSKTFGAYKKLAVQMKEVAEDGSFYVDSKNSQVQKTFDAQGSLIVTNMDAISSELYKKKNQ